METLKARLWLIAFSMLLSGVAFGKVAPEQDRKTFHTEHFRIHYPSHYQVFSEILASRLEEAFALLSQDLSWRPESKTEVVVRGDIDSPNGFAEVFPYNRLVIHAVAPEPWGFFSESDDWIRTLAIHELTHIIANDETSGLFRFLRSVIGSAGKVNPYQPSWLIEGLAVFEETRLTQAGRGRSVWNNMIVREAMQSGLFNPGGTITLDRLNDGIPYWPAGHTPYLFGYLLTCGMTKVGGGDAPFRISKLNSAHLPFAVERVAKESLGKGYPEIWEEVIARLRPEIEKDRAKIQADKTTEVKRLTHYGRRTRGFAVMREGTLFIRDSQREGVGLSLLKDGETTNLSHWRWDGGSRLRATQSRREAVYSKFAPFREHSLYSDLYLYDLDSRSETKLTEGARGFDPDVSSDFLWDAKLERVIRGSIVFIKSLPDGNQGIALFDGEKEKLVYSGTRFERLATPVFGHGVNKDKILFTEKSRTEGEKLRVLGEKSIDLTQPKSIREAILTPEWAEDGNIYYSSGAGGVFNLNRLAPTGVITRLTNAVGGLIQPIVLSGVGPGVKLGALSYGEGGWDLAEVSELGNYPVAGPGLTSLDEKLFPGSEAPASSLDKSSDQPVAMSAEKYSVFPALIPQYWAPDIRRVPDGWTLGIQTSSYDAWESHQYRLYAGYDSRTPFPLADLNYQYDGLFPTFELSLRQENRYFANYHESNRIRTGELRAYVPAGWDSNLVLGGTASNSQFFGGEESTGGFELGWDFRRMRVYDDSIDRLGESGVGLGTTLTGYFGGKERFSSFSTKFEARIPSPISRHFFRVAADYAHSNNDRIEALYFLGGGEETISASRDFLFRGYEPGTVFGREILTSNFEYHFPVADIFRGFGTLPVFFKRTRVKLFVDAASAEYVGADQRGLSRWPLGAGIHFLSDFNLLYRVPVTLGVGFDRGFSRDLGGENRIVFGLFGTDLAL